MFCATASFAVIENACTLCSLSIASSQATAAAVGDAEVTFSMPILMQVSLRIGDERFAEFINVLMGTCFVTANY